MARFLRCGESPLRHTAAPHAQEPRRPGRTWGVYVLHEDASLHEGQLRLAGGLAERDIPIRVSDALDERIERLDDALRDLLGIASVEGAQFLTATLARVANTNNTDLLRRLDEAENRHRIVRYAEALQRQLFRYEFAHLLLHQRINERLPARFALATTHRSPMRSWKRGARTPHGQYCSTLHATTRQALTVQPPRDSC